jgi:cytochrome c556
MNSLADGSSPVHRSSFLVHRLIVIALLAAIPAAAADKPSDVVKYRQSMMKAIGAHMSAMSLVVKKQVSDRSQLAAHAGAVRDLSGGIPSFFPRDTSRDKTRTAAKNEIWQRFADFKALSEKLQRESEKLADAAKRGDAKAFDAQFENVASVCGECHQTFRQKDSD